MKMIGVICENDSDASFGILAALARSCGLDIRHIRAEECGAVIGCIQLGRLPTQPGLAGSRASIQVIRSDAARAANVVRFGTGRSAPLPFCGRVVNTGSAVPEVPCAPAGEVIATAGDSPVWITDTKDGARHDTCWVSAPWIQKGDCVFDLLNAKRFMSLLPILEWMRWVSDWRSWQQPNLRACFMFDDPNFHASRYGYVNYDQLAAEGRQHRYHSTFATVPLDSYYVNSAASQVIRENSATLSFLVHGNNHTYRELSDRVATPAHRLAQMQQAISRISRLEAKARVPVSRVMAPPHGVCSAEMMSAMLGAGFEAVCVSHGSVRTGNPEAEWSTSLGAFPAMMISGLPVIPRFGLDRKPENQVLLAAYLNQPIIPVGHHWDLAGGMDILSHAANCINGLGAVHWGDMTMIARSNYRFRVEGTAMHLHPYARRIQVKIPDGITELRVQAPWMDADCDTVGFRSQFAAPTQPQGYVFGVSSGEVIDLTIVRRPGRVESPVKLPRTPINVIVRKLLVELRDRAMPFLPGSLGKR